MAIGVGVAVGSNSKEATPVHAGSSTRATLNTAAANTPIATSNSYANYGETSTSYQWAVTCGSKQTAGLWLGSNSTQKAKMTLGNGSYSDASGIATAISVQTTSTYYAAIIQRAGSIANVDEVTLTYTTPGGTAPSEAWILYSTSGTTWNVFQKVTSLSTSGTTFSHANVASARYAFVIHSTNYCQFKVPVLTFKGTDATTQTITVDPVSQEAYEDETISLTTNAASANWALSNNTCGASLSAASGKTVSVSATSAGSVRVTATASGYTSPYVDLTFNERPAGTYYTVTDSLTNASLSSTADVEEDAALNLTITAADHYTLPASITVTMGGNSFSSYTYTRNSGNRTASFSIAAGIIKGNLVISGSAVEDAKYTVTYVHGDHGTGNNYVVNNVYGGSYTLATFATAGFTASSGYSFKKWSVGGVEYAEGASVTISGATTVTAIYQEVTTYTILTNVNTLVDGTEFVLVGYASSSYRIDKGLNSGHIKMNTVTAATTISNGTSSGSTLVTTEADVYTLKGSAGAWEIVNSSGEYLQFTGTSNGNDSFTDTSSADTKFSISLSDGKVVIASNSRSSRYLYYNTSTGDLRNYGATSTSVIACYMFAYNPPQNELSSIALSGEYKTSFASGETFSFSGTVTASYTIDDPKTVTGSTTFHLDSSTGTNMSGVTMTHAAHDGHTIYAKYTEGGITKTATYSISVAHAPVSSLTLASSTGKVATKELFDMSEIGVTILPADAVQTYEWTVLSNTVNNDYTFEADIVEAGNTEGTITLKCTSTADSSKYQTFVLTVSGNPVVSLPGSVTLYTGKTTTVTASVEGGTSPYSYSWSITSGGSYASISSGGSSATVTLSGSAAGSVTLQCTVTDSNSKSDSASVTFSVTASAVTAVNWSASAFDVFSGATIPSNIDDTWEVNYEKNNGDADYITFGDYELYLGSKEITSLPYTFVAEDDGKELHVEYGGVSSSTVSVAVTQSINAVTASLTDSWDHTFTAKAWSAAGDWTISEKLWTMSGTDDGTPYFGYDATKGQQFGSGTHPFSDVSLQSSAFSGTIDSVTVYTSGANSINATVQVSVGGTAYGSAQTITNTNTAYTFDLGGESGTISIDWVNSSSKAIYVKEIVVNTVSGSTNIANNASHKAAQRAVVAFAQAFNAAMDDTENCTTGLDAAWATCESAYESFKSAAAALGETEEAWAKNLIKYATAQYSDDSAEACLERMMKTYEVCVQKHGKTAFMSDLVTLSRISINPLQTSAKSTGTAIAIIAISAVSLAAIGGYFLFRKKKED